MFSGSLGITVVGTLITFWPTMLRTKMVENALGTSVRALILMCVGVGVTTLASLFGMRPLAGAGLLVYSAGAADRGVGDGANPSHEAPHRVPQPPMSVGAGFIWLIIGVVWACWLGVHHPV